MSRLYKTVYYITILLISIYNHSSAFSLNQRKSFRNKKKKKSSNGLLQLATWCKSRALFVVRLHKVVKMFLCVFVGRPATSFLCGAEQKRAPTGGLCGASWHSCSTRPLKCACCVGFGSGSGTGVRAEEDACVLLQPSCLVTHQMGPLTAQYEQTFSSGQGQGGTFIGCRRWENER